MGKNILNKIKVIPLKIVKVRKGNIMHIAKKKDLKNKIQKFKEDESDHKNIAYESGASNKGIYSIMDKMIKTGSKIAINISEKI